MVTNPPGATVTGLLPGDTVTGEELDVPLDPGLPGLPGLPAAPEPRPPPPPPPPLTVGLNAVGPEPPPPPPPAVP